jgi:YesN/AraC family two-component response regulator
MFLETFGYTVLDSGDSGEAFRMAEEHPGPLPLMITDVVMPGFSGPVLAEKLASTRPETRVLYTSGYTAEEFARDAAPGPDRAFLTKPFGRDDLVRKVRELLDLPAPPIKCAFAVSDPGI